MPVRSVYLRRSNVEKRIGRQLRSPNGGNVFRPDRTHPQRAEMKVRNGSVLIGSDGHYWPGKATTAHRAFVKFSSMLKPVGIVFNGDAFDGARISRHPPIGWEDNPTVEQEIETTKERLGEIEEAAPDARKVWTLGNHDARFETRLATVAPEYARIHGFHLRDHFPVWEPAWSCWINDSVVVKHRFRGGTHATYNNTLNAGKTVVTGHLHSLKVTPFNDYNGTRYGVDTGCLADPDGPQFMDYSEDNPRNHRAGFIVLTFHKGVLLWPEPVAVIAPGKVQFRGQIFSV
ncbi:MAG TPA: hypothetical protein VKT73_13265 [Xanthobacteraceae bacterium]|nr:hypothetical protein [Xanthobacteraceae bacterium]